MIIKIILTEKYSIAKKLAETFRDFKYVKLNNYLCFKRTELEYIIPLSGHFISYDYPLQTKNWHKCNGKELLTNYQPYQKINYFVKNLLLHFKDKTIDLDIATDADEEGEKIGYDFLKEIAKVAKINEVNRISLFALNNIDILNAFENKIKKQTSSLATSTKLRHIIDLMWGYTLSRDISLYRWRSIKDKKFFSIGRVQTPLLGLINDREKELRNWKKVSFNSISFYLLKKLFKLDKAQEENLTEIEYEKISENFQNNDFKISISMQELTKFPPLPYNTTDLLKLSTKLKKSVSTIAAVAENLYLKGYITYPRTDNNLFTKNTKYLQIYANLLKAGLIPKIENPKYTRKIASTGDHECIIPTLKICDIATLTPDEKSIYLEIIGSFFRTLSSKTDYNYYTITVYTNLNDRVISFSYNYAIITKKGWYSPKPLEENELDFGEARPQKLKMEKNETKPPALLSQQNLIAKMDSLDIGTKSTRGTLIKTLYLKNYISGFRPKITEKGKILVDLIETTNPYCFDSSLTIKLKNDLKALEKDIEKYDFYLQKYKTFILNLLKI